MGRAYKEQRLCDNDQLSYCVLLSVAPWTVSGQELFLVVARSEWAALRRGTLCRQNCVLYSVCPGTVGKKLKTCLFESSY